MGGMLARMTNEFLSLALCSATLLNTHSWTGLKDNHLLAKKQGPLDKDIYLADPEFIIHPLFLQDQGTNA
jgi:hypothetical protein